MFDLYPFKFSAIMSVDSIIILKIVDVEFAMDHYVRFEIPRTFKIGVEIPFHNMYDSLCGSKANAKPSGPVLVKFSQNVYYRL